MLLDICAEHSETGNFKYNCEYNFLKVSSFKFQEKMKNEMYCRRFIPYLILTVSHNFIIPYYIESQLHHSLAQSVKNWIFIIFSRQYSKINLNYWNNDNGGNNNDADVNFRWNSSPIILVVIIHSFFGMIQIIIVIISSFIVF